jgi:hypothetical protein
VATSAETDKIDSSLRAQALQGKPERLTERHGNEKCKSELREHAINAAILMQVRIHAQKSYEK